MNSKLMTHIVAGYPTMEDSFKLGIKMARAGVKYLEIQIPFSDPVADGPVIMKACEKSLENGTKVKDCFDLMNRLSSKFKEEGLKTELLFMTYFNIVLKYGVSSFCTDTNKAGAYGLIVPDIPLDEEQHEGYLKACRENDLNAIQAISPITPEERLKKISEVSSGFVYCVSRYGTTGVKANLNPLLKDYLLKVREHIKLPLALGFGISSREQISEALKYADIAVIGSAVIEGKIEF